MLKPDRWIREQAAQGMIEPFWPNLVRKLSFPVTTCASPRRSSSSSNSMTDTPDHPPLWRVMHDAFLSSTLSGEEGHQGFAQEIRAVRDWLLPEEPEEAPYVATDLGWMVNSDNAIRWANCQRLRAQLTAEAERAERGDG